MTDRLRRRVRLNAPRSRRRNARPVSHRYRNGRIGRPEERVVIERSIRNRTRLEERGEEDGPGAIAAEALSVDGIGTDHGRLERKIGSRLFCCPPIHRASEMPEMIRARRSGY